MKPEIIFDLTRFEGIKIKKPLAEETIDLLFDEMEAEFAEAPDENEIDAFEPMDETHEMSNNPPEVVAVVMKQVRKKETTTHISGSNDSRYIVSCVTEHESKVIEIDGYLPRQFGRKMPTLVSVNDHTSEDYFYMGLELGPIAALMKDDTINDILINGTESIYIERQGILEETEFRYHSDEEVLRVASRIAQAAGRKLSKRRPMVDTRLPDGSRVNIIAPPMAVDGTTISIRKFPQKKITIDSMMEAGNITLEMSAFLKACAKYKLNILISGGTGSGKTTLLNAMTRYIPETERIITIEDSAELQLQQPHVIRLETKMPDQIHDRIDEVTIRDLVKNALRMRPDRIIVGEVRGAEAFDMMQAMNTGHEGSFTTLHANSPRDALSRLENMVNMGDMKMSQSFIRKQIVSSIDLIVHVNRFTDGTRRVTSISELVGMESDTITMQELFAYNVTEEWDNGVVKGHFSWGNIIPRSPQLAKATKETGLFDCQKKLKKSFFQ